MAAYRRLQALKEYIAVPLGTTETLCIAGGSVWEEVDFCGAIPSHLDRLTEKQADGKVDKAKPDSFGCINQCLRASVWVKTTPARSRALSGYTASSNKCGFGAKACTSGMGSSIAAVVQSSIQVLKSTWGAKKRKKKELTAELGLVPQLLGCSQL